MDQQNHLDEQETRQNDFLRQYHPQRQAYDQGHRKAIQSMLKTLVEAARSQVRRSAQTAECADGDDYDRDMAALDERIFQKLGRISHLLYK